MFDQPKIQLLIDQGRHDEAVAAIREALSGDFDNVWLYYLLSVTHLAQDKPRAAEAAAREAISREPEFDLGFFALAQALLDRRRLRDAQKAIDEALRIDPDDATYYAVKARILGERNKNKEALEMAETGLALDPDNDSCRFYRGVILARLGRHEEAADESLGLLADDPEAASNHCARGWTLIQAGRGKEAQERFVEALRIDPESEDARTGLVHAMKLSNPFTGIFLRLLILLDRIPILYLLIGIVVITRIAGWLKNSDFPQPIPFLGDLFLVVFCFFFLISLVVDPLFNLILRFSRTGKHALTNSQSKAVKWFVAPLVIGLLILGLWLFRGANSFPFAALAWFAVAKVVYELFETGHPQVRWAMGLLVLTTVCVAVWIEYASVSIIRPQLVEWLAEIRNAGESPPDRESLDAILKQRDRIIKYPAYGVMILACFADNIRDWFFGLVERDQ